MERDAEIKRDVNLSTYSHECCELLHVSVCVHTSPTEMVWEKQHPRSDEDIPRPTHYFPIKGPGIPEGITDFRAGQGK